MTSHFEEVQEACGWKGEGLQLLETRWLYLGTQGQLPQLLTSAAFLVFWYEHPAATQIGCCIVEHDSRLRVCIEWTDGMEDAAHHFLKS